MASGIGPRQLIEGQDYDAKIAFTEFEAAIATDDQVIACGATERATRLNADLLSRSLMKEIKVGDVIASCHIWTTDEKTRKIGLNNFCRIPLKELAEGGFEEGKVITILYDGNPLRVRCSQLESERGNSYKMEQWPYRQQTVSVYNPEKRDVNPKPFDFPAYIRMVKEQAIPKITKPEPAPRQTPNLDVSFSQRKEHFLTELNRQREAGETGFVLRAIEADGKAGDIYAHPFVLSIYSPFFQTLNTTTMLKGKDVADGRTIYELKAPINTVQQVVDYLYTNRVNPDNTALECMNLIGYCKLLQLNESCADFVNFTLLNLRSKLSQVNVWDVIQFASLHEDQQIIDLVEEYLTATKINLLDCVDVDTILKFSEGKYQPFISFIFDQFRSRLIEKKDPELWYTLYQYTKWISDNAATVELNTKWISHNAAFNELNQVCLKLAAQSPEVLQKYCEENSTAALNELNIGELKAKITEAKKLKCQVVIDRVTEILGL